MNNATRAAVAVYDFFVESAYSFLRNNESSLARILRQRLLKTNCYIDSAVVVTNRKNIDFGIDCALYHGTYILNGFGHITMSDRSHLGAFCYANVQYGSLTIGQDVAIGPGTKIIVYSNHYESQRKVTETRLTQDIFIGNNVLIGANCTLLPGTTIMDNTVIGAGTIVKGTLNANAIYAGVPAKQISAAWYD